MPLETGTRLGPYEVTGQLGAGGMGEVYRARDTSLDRDVAIKVLPAEFASDPERLARFEREAKVLASLNHPNIAHIHGLERSGDAPALILELVPGPTLQDRISQGAIPLDEALPIAKQIAEALEAAHEQGIIHRDLKPANIKVTPDGIVKVLDFGLAKALEPERTDEDIANSPTMSMTAAATKMGMIMGTAAYMSPEQARGKPVDKRSDIWAFGVVLFEMLAGRRLFESEDVSLTLADVMRAEPAWDVLPEAVTPTVRAVLHRCLEKEPKHRIRDIGDVGMAMEGAFESPGSVAMDTTGSIAQLALWQRPMPLLIAAVALLGLGALMNGALTVWNQAPPDPPLIVRTPISLGEDEVLSISARGTVAISPDGSHVVYVINRGLSLRPVDQLQATPIAATEGGRNPFFSPDGEWIGYQGDGQLKKVALAGGAPISLGEVGSIFGASWGADDTILVGQGPNGIWRVPGSGGTPEQLIAVEGGEQAHGPEMLPGGEWVLFSVLSAGAVNWDEAQVVVQSLETNERVDVIAGGRDARYLPTGHIVYGLAGVLYAGAFDLETRRLVGGSVSLVEGVRMNSLSSGAAHFSVARNGSLVYVPGPVGLGTGQRGLMWVTDSGQEEHLDVGSGSYLGVSLSPDGTRAALGTTAVQNPDVWVAELERGSLTRVTTDAAPETKPLWTPDGASVVFESTRDGVPTLYRKAADGTGTAERLFASDGATEIAPLDWTPDGTALVVVVRTPETSADIGLVSMEPPGSWEPLIQTDAQEWYPALSPDGRWLAYTSNETGSNEVYVQRFPELGQRRPISIGGGFGPSWSADGTALFYLFAPEGPPRAMMRVAIESDATTLTAGQPGRLFDRTFFDQPGRHLRYDVSSDGRFLMIADDGGTAAQASVDALVLVQHWFEELKARVPTGQ